MTVSLMGKSIYLPEDVEESLELEECLLRFFFFFEVSLAVSLL